MATPVQEEPAPDLQVHQNQDQVGVIFAMPVVISANSANCIRVEQTTAFEGRVGEQFFGG